MLFNPQKTMRKIFFITLLSLLGGSCLNNEIHSLKKPNIILVMTDDQGYGDLSCHGNPWLKTPNLDRLHEQSIRLTNFHVSPTCAPTRAALLTGHYTNRTGAWHTIGGRSLLRESEVTMADVLASNGYSTGIFGKWHLGDNYPFRPQDRGFQEVLIHKGGGVGQAPDYMDNNYFNDTYFHNGVEKKYRGYCTDIWFQGAIDFIKSNSARPFFCYLVTNAPHSPYFISDKYSEPYRNNPEILNPEFYGMIANFDENLGKLRETIQELGIEEDTITIFMTDNGTSSGTGMETIDGFMEQGFNAGMRGKKGSMYEGGHRVPCFINWPGSTINPGIDVDELTSHIDLLPTLIDMLDLEIESSLTFDGISIKDLLNGKAVRPDRSIITDSQRIQHPEKWRRSAVMEGKWRLVNGKELYNLTDDPEQCTDIAEKFPGKLSELRERYEEWWKDISPVFKEYPAIVIGSGQEKISALSSHDVHTDGPVVWNHAQVRSGEICNGWWALRTETAGTYKISLRRWPIEINTPICSGLDSAPAVRGTSVPRSVEGKALPITGATLKIGGFEENKPVGPQDTNITFEVDLNPGETRLHALFTGDDDLSLCAYYVYIEKE
jgi:arylsulfatase A-like enzyme